MRALRIGLVLLATGVSLCWAGEDFGRLNPAAPPETEQYAFLVGDWHCKTRSMRPDRTFVEGRARWNGRYILDGWAIQDTWISLLPDGRESYGTNIRSFNTETNTWDNRWLPAGTLQWSYFESEQIGDTMVMTGGGGSSPNGDFIDRNTFYDITPDSWEWRKDRSFDGGETWFEGVAFISATREPAPLLERVTHGFVQNGDVKLHYAELGKGRGPLVVLLHGFPDYWYTWRDQMDALAKTHHVVALDLRGYNKSDAPDGVDAYAMRNLIGDVAATVQHFGKSKAVIVGHDWGGAIAWQVAQWRPDIVDKLIVLSTPHPAGLSRELLNNPEQQANSAYAHRFQQEGAHEALTADGLAGWVNDADAKPHYVEAFKRSNFEGMLNYYKANYPKPQPEGAAPSPPPSPSTKIACPVLVIHGLEDKALLPSGFDGTWQWIEGPLTQVALPGVGHFVQDEAFAQVSEAMVDWLND